MKTVWSGDDVVPELRLHLGTRSHAGIADRLARVVFGHSDGAHVTCLLGQAQPPSAFEARCWQGSAVAPDHLEDRFWEPATARRPVAMPPRRLLL
jgi:predicted alpha/beta hydrolase